MEVLCCPRCHGTLSHLEDCLECGKCGARFPFDGCSGEFTASLELDESARWQRDIYEGRVSEQASPAYLDEQGVREHLKTCLAAALGTGALAPSWLGVEFRRAADLLEPKPSESVLDVGCGTGLMLAAVCAAYGTRGVGVDFSSEAVAVARRCDRAGAVYHTADALALPFRDGSFDLAVSFGVIEHVSDPALMVSEISRVLHPGGRALIYTLSRRDRWTWHWWQRLTSRGKYGLGCDEMAGHDPEAFMLPEELESMMRGAGFGRTRAVPVHTLYTLIFDESFPGLFYRLIDRPAAFAAVGTALELADAWPNARGYSSEFLALGWK